MRRAGVLALAVCMYASWPGSVTARQPAQSSYPRVPRFDETYDWARLVSAHEMGRVDDALRALAKWPDHRLERVRFDLALVRRVLLAAAQGNTTAFQTGAQRPGVFLPNSSLSVFSLEALLDLPKGVRSVTDGPRELVRADGEFRRAIAVMMAKAAMLHTDLMLMSPEELRAARIETSRSAQQASGIVDGQRIDMVSGAQHWGIARLAIDFLLPVPKGQPVLSEWYNATSTFLLARRDYDSGRQHLEHAATRYPADARVAFLLGAVYENLASPRIQALADDDRAGLRLETRAHLLPLAEKFLRVAVDVGADTKSAEPSLRLARILEMTGRYEEAVRILEGIRTGLPRDELTYYAELFLGRALQSLERDDEARAAFARARDLYPRAQSAHLALGQIAWHTSQPAEATGNLERLHGLNRAPDQADATADPWWIYDVSPALDVRERIAAMRRAISDFVR